MEKKEIIFSIDELDEIVKTYLLPQLKTYKIFTFQGPLGAGKTTMIKSFLRLSGVAGPVVSPTFTYLKEYTAPEGIFYHFDLYRLGDQSEFVDLGFDELLYKEKSWSVIEWPEVIRDLLVNSSLHDVVYPIKLNYYNDDEQKRVLSIKS